MRGPFLPPPRFQERAQGAGFAMLPEHSVGRHPTSKQEKEGGVVGRRAQTPWFIVNQIPVYSNAFFNSSPREFLNERFCHRNIRRRQIIGEELFRGRPDQSKVFQRPGLTPGDNVNINCEAQYGDPDTGEETPPIYSPTAVSIPSSSLSSRTRRS